MNVRLFGGLQVEYDGTPVQRYGGCKVQELLCYVLLNRDREHQREVLAGVLWGDRCTTEQSRTYLRKALWQLQAGLGEISGGHSPISADPEWIRVNPEASFGFDVATLEEGYALVRDVPGAQLDDVAADSLERAASAYSGNLLEGWYQDWCLAERERLQQIYLLMLDKLMTHALRVGSYELGITYGEHSLRQDRARERTYQRLMRLHEALGDRTGALHRYELCVAALAEELDVAPSAETTKLVHSIRAGAMDSRELPGVTELDSELDSRLDRLAMFQRRLYSLQKKVHLELEAVLRALRNGDAR